MNEKAFLAARKQRKSTRPQHSYFKNLVVPKSEQESFAKAERPSEMPKQAARPPVLSGLEPYAGAWGIKEAAHLLRRTTFGAKYPDVKRLAAMSASNAIAEIMTPFSGDFPKPVNDYFGEANDPDVAPGETYIGAEWNNDIEGQRIWSLKNWWLRRQINQDATIGEKMILFWHNHIPIQFFDVFWVNWNYDYLNKLYTNCLGNFKTMIREMTLDTAMLFYLNGQQNSKEEPDENYARELQELFCIGKGPDANYTEEDVQAMARVLTGWRYNWGQEKVEFATWAHDTGDKQLSAFYNNAVIDGRSGSAGQFELDDLLDIIFDNNEVAAFVCRKIYRFFVYHEIDADTEANVIQPLADIFRNNNYEIMPVMDALVRSQHFFDTANRGAMIKPAVDYQVSLCREFNVDFPDASELADNYEMSGFMMYFLELMQQSIGDPPNVAGWPAYYQLPQYDKQWVSTDTLPRRLQLSDYMIFVGIESDNFTAQMNLVEITKQFSNPGNPIKLVEEAVEWLYGIDVSVGVQLVLKSILLSGQLQDYYWTNAWNEHLADPDDPMKAETVRTRLLGFYRYILRLEEYQLA